mmetsp:Transcript_517/g.780  ORF Transcript_517/g.780 Transcript_517/m.780 type:complete len:198 (+) Transcript_517:228-821(+)|eukprot:CAMPEP_0194213014 /NCGR_PEP_ID=MMETSP0156-20130528/13299_1 /TAXON_ID=33649 /ORGANISM="Thalassionema nitzschioides, Strain L26-B" /LENGTH=197 /DNA_ID=CAMNT_0038940955 /DNA_START=189 /DNA_END=782 /DNA_ORIENTATION=-
MIGLKPTIIACALLSVHSFAPAAIPANPQPSITLWASRRSVLKKGIAPTVAVVLLKNKAAFASGGATAGGAYLLSAKQRYNDRVQASLKAFLALKKPLENGSTQELKDYFSTEEVGGWKDGSAAGYLLANAFRTSSSKAPDSLPSVQKWKAFSAKVESIMKAAKKKDASKTLAAFKDSLSALDEYLEQVELPPGAEL